MILASARQSTSGKIPLGGQRAAVYCKIVQATIDIDAQLLREAEVLARSKGQPLSRLVEEALRNSLRTSLQQAAPGELYGEPLTDEDIAESARLTFRILDAEEGRAQTR